MMTGITRYITRQLLIGTALVSVVLVFIVWLTQSLRFLQFVMSKGLPLGTWLKLTVYMLPGFFTLILPSAFFFVVLFVYNKLAMDKELVVVQAAGVSRLGVAKAATLTATGLTILGLILSSLIVPASVQGFKDLQFLIRTDVSQVLLREGAFNALGDGLTVYVREHATNGELLDLMVNDARNPQKPVTLLAARGVVREAANNTRVVMLFKGSRQERLSPEKLSVLYFDTYALDLGMVTGSEGQRNPDNRERWTWDLLSLDEKDGYAPNAVDRMRAEAHQRLTAPFAALGYALLATAWLLLGSFDRRGQWRRIGGAVLTVVVLQAAALSAMNATAKSDAFAPLMYIVAFLPIIVSAYVLARGSVHGVPLPPVIAAKNKAA
ncbi:MAG: LptF/LptG family permease [Rhodospirillaceae bacterium]|nr:LptF/LptG family permease [Rhodospirillaceae bacterium]